MSIFFDFGVALQSTLPFKEAWKRIRCLNSNHKNHSNAQLIEKQHFEKHPHSDAHMIYTVNLMKCKHCTLNFLDSGLEYRRLK